MIGWEYPPFIVGGLGRVCYHLTNELAKKGLEIIFLTPFPIGKNKERIKFVNPKLKIVEVGSWISPYLREYQENKIYNILGDFKSAIYHGNLIEEVKRFSNECKKIIEHEDIDIIHCHDWMTFEAGIIAKRIKKKPLIVHVHTTEFDRSCGLGICKEIYEIERKAFDEADKIIAVSNFMKNRIIQFYNIDGNKIEVVHNSVGDERKHRGKTDNKIKNLVKGKKVILYLGRVTLHKGPDYFLRAAKIVSDFYNNVIFIVAGVGDLLPKMIDLSCELGIGDKVIFTGYIRDEEIDFLYKIADAYVMPSVSEPFGITALEAAINGTPVILSKNSGAKEILRNSLLVDFWDVNDIANKILSVLNYNVLKECLSENGANDAKKISWEKQAEKVISIYNDLW